MDTTDLAFPRLRSLAAGWLLLALCALALSTLCALLLIAARTPLPAALGASGELFRRALVLHVSLAVVVWFLCCACAFWSMAAGAAPTRARWTALALAATGLLAMAGALAAGGAPLLANYVPVLDHPLFLAGLMLFLGAVALCGAVSFRPLLRRARQGPVWRLGALLSLAAAAAALAALAVAWFQVGAVPTREGIELLAWGPGHLLQFVHVILLMSAWSVLGEQVFGRPLASRRVLAALLLVAALPLLAAPFIYASHAVSEPQFRRAFTWLMAAASWPAPALLALRLLQQFWRGGRAAWAAPLGPALLLSALLFLLGCALGAAIRGDSTMVPAHYHGTVGAVTLAYMALGFHLLPAFGARASAALMRWQARLYGAGLAMLALGLAWSGTLGVPRKTMHVDVLVQFPAYFAAMGLAGAGGLLAITGACLFVGAIGRSLLAARVRSARGRDVRWRAAWLTAGLTAALGLLLAIVPDGQGTAASAPVVAGATAQQAPQQSAQQTPQQHASASRAAEVGRRFAAGTALLNARQYDAAATELHRVLELAPQLPEAHVNMGFAMIGAKRPAMARDFFAVAIELNKNQRNAYFGLALALDGLHDVAGALGAMRSFVHLSQAGDPYLAGAAASVQRWEAALALARARPRPLAFAPLPIGGKIGVASPIHGNENR